MTGKKPHGTGWLVFLLSIVLVGGAGSNLAPLYYFPGVYRFHPVCCFSCTHARRRLRWYIIMCTTLTPGQFCWNCNAFFPAIAPPDDWLPPEAWPGLERVFTDWMRLYFPPHRAHA